MKKVLPSISNLKAGTEVIFVENCNKKPSHNPITGIITDNGCIECNSHSCDDYGYASAYKDGNVRKVHCYVYSKCCNKIPDGYLVMHSCGNLKCINHEHLLLGKQRESKEEKVTWDHQQSKNAIINEKLFDYQAYWIKFCMYGTNKEIAKLYNVSEFIITDIKTGKSWGSLKIGQNPFFDCD